MTKIVVASQEPEPVLRAAQDLRKDYAKVFGRAPEIVRGLDNSGPVAIFIAQRDHIPAGLNCATTTGIESFAFSVAGTRSGSRIVCLTGADMRGAIYAIYEFSQRILGVDPMYLWTGKEPAKRAAIPLPADFARKYPSPIFRYRGFFTNDEDLLTGWVTPKKGVQTGIALSTWDQVFETILRLKGNMVVPGTWIFPDDAQVQAASERGLIVNQHHATPLGVNVAHWPEGVPYNYSTHPEILERAWRDAVNEYKPGDDILWTVGLRGLSDESYADLDPSVRGNDKLLGKRISDAIAKQIEIVRARYPDAHFITNLWEEGDRLMREGYLKIPPEVTLVWSDTGYGDMQDGGAVAAGQGMYFHVAMMNLHANQLSEMVSVRTIQSEIGRYIKAGATGYLLVNTSDIRPVAMTARAVMEMAWGGVPATLGATGSATGSSAMPEDADGAYYRRWAAEEFGPGAASALETIYKAYFTAPAMRWQRARLRAGNYAPLPPAQETAVAPIIDGDQHYHIEARRIVLDELTDHNYVFVPAQSPSWEQPHKAAEFDAKFRKILLDADIADTAAAQPRWDAVWEKALATEPLVDPARRRYYHAEVLTQITINRESNFMLGELARAVEDQHAGLHDKAVREAAAAVKALDTIQASMAADEYGKWKNWYRGDWLTGVYRTRQLVQDYLNHLEDPMAKLPAPAEWSMWEGYFHILEYQDDRTVDIH